MKSPRYHETDRFRAGLFNLDSADLISLLQDVLNGGEEQPPPPTSTTYSCTASITIRFEFSVGKLILIAIIVELLCNNKIRKCPKTAADTAKRPFKTPFLTAGMVNMGNTDLIGVLQDVLNGEEQQPLPPPAQQHTTVQQQLASP
ncbi:unnamed protein product [Adineta steineri]|uniref:Uncharacterized protein n=1 Tax=Adineta steineri TaxID=433720 RepID=A0A819A0B5_9BILA|nr:unnamed protein product [Adineta steineri]